MGLEWNMGAFVGTMALVLIGGAIWGKMRSKQDSPIARIINKFKRNKEDDYDESMHYKRISHKGGLKW